VVAAKPANSPGSWELEMRERERERASEGRGTCGPKLGRYGGPRHRGWAGGESFSRREEEVLTRANDNRRILEILDRAATGVK
jgi:hypothetical protein